MSKSLSLTNGIKANAVKASYNSPVNSIDIGMLKGQIV
jgi:hypothetical protein